MNPSSSGGPLVRRILLAAISLVALAGPALIVTLAPSAPPVAMMMANRRQVIVPATSIPKVEPVDLVALAPDDARTINAGIPFSTGPNPAARPFNLKDQPEDLARAVDCLAAAELYEAGDDSTGEKAVAQVVLNRVRHPAFPRTICGVVFEGSERSTGCQFTFTCDGAMVRRQPSAAGWDRARKIARSALTGSVFKPVGYATHYHTDWVVPYWQSSLDKIAAVGTHLFFRWSGWWGTPPAFNRRTETAEPVIAALAGFSDAHTPQAAIEQADAMVDAPVMISTAADGAADTFLVRVDPRAPPDSYQALAIGICGNRLHCTVMGWGDQKSIPVALPATPVQRSLMTFSYLRDRPSGFEKALWNCTQIRRSDTRQCMKPPTLLRLDEPHESQLAPGPRIDTPLPVLKLDGVRRRGMTDAEPGMRPGPVTGVTPPGTSPAPAPSAIPRPPRSSGGALQPPA